jgi:hypothetical protein
LGNWKEEQRSGLGISVSPSMEIRALWVDDSPSGVSLIKQAGGNSFHCAVFEDSNIKYIDGQVDGQMHKFKDIKMMEFLGSS